MTGLVVVGIALGTSGLLVSAWCVWDVATTDRYLLEVGGRSKGRWLAVVLVPLLGPACWVEQGRPPSGVALVVPRRHLDNAP